VAGGSWPDERLRGDAFVNRLGCKGRRVGIGPLPVDRTEQREGRAARPRAGKIRPDQFVDIPVLSALRRSIESRKRAP